MKTILVENNGDFAVYKEIYPIKYYGTTHGYYRNTNTGENCGQSVEIYEGEDDCYELVTEDENA